MDPESILESIIVKNETKILFLVADGLGGLPGKDGKTELEAAETPNLDRLASNGTTGMFHPVAPGVTPGSGPGHLALFGYDPVRYDIGRGVLSALGIDFPLRKGDVAARGNFCTVDEKGRITDRRAGRISSERGAALSEKLNRITLEGVELFVEPVEEHRFLLVLRGPDLGSGVEDTDPQRMGVEPFPPRAGREDSARTAELVRIFIAESREILHDQHPANMVLLRGFDSLPEIPLMEQRYGLKGLAVAAYPMYRGIARLLGMEVRRSGADPEDAVKVLRSEWPGADFFFLHYKKTDSAGEDGDFDGKVRAIEKLDRSVSSLLDLGPDVLVVTGDHSTPALLRSHSWHPVPVLLSASNCRPDHVGAFGETACSQGGLGQMPMKLLMPIALGHAGRLKKYGA